MPGGEYASERGRAHRMAGREATRITVGALLYCLAYLAAWLQSIDQWYLPAGLRLACIIFLPRRLWVAPLIGEIAAMTLLQVPYAWQRGIAWTVLSPLRNFPIIAGAALFLGFGGRGRRKSSPEIKDLIGLGLVACLASTVANMSLASALIPGYWKNLDIAKSLIFSLGDYLGIMLIVPACFIWHDRRCFMRMPGLVRDSAITICALLALGLIYLQAMHTDVGGARLCCLAAIIPAIALTVRHGWRGAAIGVTLANAFDAMAMTSPIMLGARDDSMMLVQASVALLGTCLISGGSMISHYYGAARQERLERNEALRVAQRGYSYAEDHLRKLRADMAHLIRRSAVPSLATANGVRVASTASQGFVADLDTIYATNLDSFGLFAALESPSVVDEMTRAGIIYAGHLKGPAHRLPESFQRAAYRIAVDALTHFRIAGARDIRLTVRVSRTGRLRAVIVVSANGITDTTLGQQHLIDAQDRCKAFGALARTRPKRFTAVLQP